MGDSDIPGDPSELPSELLPELQSELPTELPTGFPSELPTPAPEMLVAPRRRRRWPIAVAGVVVIAVAAAITVVLTDGGSGSGKQQNAAATTSARPATSASPTASEAPTFDPTNLQMVLDAQSKALLSGDEKAFLAPVDPTAKSAVTAYQRMYHNLRAMHVKVFSQNPPGSLVDSTPRPVSLMVSYCLVVTTCKDTIANWTVYVQLEDGKAMITRYIAPGADNFPGTPLPWQLTTLTAVVGPRVVVATSSDLASKLPNALKIANHAAVVDDAFAKWGKPSVYVVYLADHAEFPKWFDSQLTYKQTTAFTTNLSTTDIPATLVMPDSAEFTPGGLTYIMQSEMARVAVEQQESSQPPDNTIEEGLADYCGTVGHTNWESYVLQEARSYIRSGKWSHQVYLTKETQSSNVDTVNATFGIGYLAVRYLVTTYGLDKMLTFFGDLEHNSQTLDVSSRDAFGKAWTTVNAAAVKYIEKDLGV